jgi:hypothetical protein
MSKELPYFKFFISEWILGRISDHPDKVQGAFIIAICHYWNKQCDYNRNDFERKIGKKRFKMLLDLKFFDVENETIRIDFLDEQFLELSGTKKVNSTNGKLGAEKRWRGYSEANSETIALREDKDKDKDKDNINEFFKSLLNGSDLERIAMNNKLTIIQAKEYVELFKPKAELTYQTYAKFVSHFKNWLVLNKPKTGQDRHDFLMNAGKM